MNKALLDSDIYSEILKAIDQTVTRNATTYRQALGNLTFSVITVMEIIQKREGQALFRCITLSWSQVCVSATVVIVCLSFVAALTGTPSRA